MKLANAIPTIVTTSKVMFLERFDTKFEICLLPKGSIMALTSFSANINNTSCNIGEIIVANNKNSPLAPTAFLIKFEEARITPKPSLI